LPNSKDLIFRITAIWAFSEAALGGVLHAFKFPFNGLVLSSAAVVFISLIAYFSETRGAIIKSTLLVIIIKASVSPHTPVNAHMAVLLQGLLGELFFFTRKGFKISAFVFAVTVLLLSSFQKVLTVTIVFGMQFWEAIDVFFNSISKNYFGFVNDELSISFILIGVYFFFHLFAGVLAGFIAGTLPKKLIEKSGIVQSYVAEDFSTHLNNKKAKKKKWYKKPVNLFVVLLFVSMVAYSYFSPNEFTGLESMVFMIVLRSLIVLVAWLFIISPLVTNLLGKLLKKKESKYAKEIAVILDLFPAFKNIVIYNWRKAVPLRNVKSFWSFLANSITMLLFYNAGEWSE
jgi:hypothetical protein